MPSLLEASRSRGPIDWSLWDGMPLLECECSCGNVHFSHATVRWWMTKAGNPVVRVVTRRACPVCHRPYGCKTFRPIECATPE